MAEAGSVNKYCVIGAGPSGMAVAKAFLARSIPFDWFERESDIGGLWNIKTQTGVVYETTHLISASLYTAFEDFPMEEEEYPLYPSHASVMDYFRSYANQFGLLDKVQLSKSVEHVAPRNGNWQVRISGEGTPRFYKGVVLANGHHFVPRVPRIPGQFDGEVIHSRAYKSPKQLRDKRVLVIGGGNSGCDIVIDAVHNAECVVHSMRRGYWFVPKFLLGFPTHGTLEFLEWLRMPRWLKARVLAATYYLLVGPPERYGLARPDHGIHQSHPTMTDEIPRQLEHGRITLKPDVARFAGNEVVFEDGTSEEIDLVVCATGYEISFPFLDNSLVLGYNGVPLLYMNVFHPRHEGLFAAGLIQANGSIWRLADDQAQLIATAIVAREKAPEVAENFRDRVIAAGPDRGMQRHFVESDRHKLEVNYYEYRRALKRLLRKFGPLAKTALDKPDWASSDDVESTTHVKAA